MSLCNLSLSSPFNLIEDDRFPMLLLYMDYLSFVKIFKGHYTRSLSEKCQSYVLDTYILWCKVVVAQFIGLDKSSNYIFWTRYQSFFLFISKLKMRDKSRYSKNIIGAYNFIFSNKVERSFFSARGTSLHSHLIPQRNNFLKAEISSVDKYK
jgi:hypothetical protein